MTSDELLPTQIKKHARVEKIMATKSEKKSTILNFFSARQLSLPLNNDFFNGCSSTFLKLKDNREKDINSSFQGHRHALKGNGSVC